MFNPRCSLCLDGSTTPDPERLLGEQGDSRAARSVRSRAHSANSRTFADQQTDWPKNISSARIRFCNSFPTAKCTFWKQVSLGFVAHPLHPRSKGLVQVELILVLITIRVFLWAFNSGQSPQQEEGVGRGWGHPTHHQGGLPPTPAKTTEIFVGLLQSNRSDGKGKGNQQRNFATRCFCCCGLLLGSFLMVMQENCQKVRGHILEGFMGWWGYRKT